MSAFHLTSHAISRMTQRGIGMNDIELIEWIGTPVEGGYLVRMCDFQAFDQKLKQARNRVRRLVGKRLVLDGDCVVTAYHAHRRKERQLLR